MDSESSESQNEENEIVEESEEVEESQEENEEATEEEDESSRKVVANKNIKDLETLNENIFIISLQLLKKFNEMKQCDPDSIILDYLTKVGLPMQFKNAQTLSLYLYFHKICSSFYSLFNKISSKDINKTIISLLKENYYLLADKESKHYNYIDMAQKAFPKLKISEEDTDISKIPVILQNKISDNSQDFQIKKLIK